MTRAKIMLISIIILATVGTTLAFKVVKKGVTTYCYERTTQQPAHCLQEINEATAVEGELIYFYTTKTAPCDQLDCNKTCEHFNP